ncbi:MAG: flagellar basal body rod protein FlgC [Methylobacterium sp.]|jgi:flagellar basal-body rod protein FlgC|uniref:flagellar basal body rod protein FlgC n=1 Tax=Rhabdaerophilum sp. TaxID=2717341 RepID=UPI002A217D67|nr:flagellar basal body rod protein FlgC [Methylobacterium sp.]MCE2932446.1 flagellar basal body rod protein FlgC [Hyphomicrobiales bacterium]MCA3635179.1 flagellar basal body rod protein FlgC [Methylobacterium sp.]MCA3638501.1 flagellar basal body rod protein FlgC [Methylobacterium sp.]MCA3640924.1 flagellar basal body rod protein FlgC [Methylobacterium sp.]
MDFLKSLAIAASGLRAQSGRMRVIAENVANADTTPTRPGEQPYRRKVVTFQQKLDNELGVSTVQLGKIKRDRSEFKTRFEPGNPLADARGFVQKPNVDTMMETLDLREAQRSYEANLNVISTTRRMLARTLEILRA